MASAVWPRMHSRVSPPPQSRRSRSRGPAAAPDPSGRAGAAGLAQLSVALPLVSSVTRNTSAGVRFPGPPLVTPVSLGSVVSIRMTQLHDLRLRLLVQQESERIADATPDDLDLSVIQARCLCWLALLAEAHEDQASDAERRGDVEQAMGWFADSMRLRDVIQVVSSIEIPLPPAADGDEDGGLDDASGHGLDA